MKSVFDIARSHVSLRLSSDVNALRRVLRDWQHYTERLKLQEKATHPAELCITVQSPRRAAAAAVACAPSRDLSLECRRPSAGEAVFTRTKSIPLRLWTALLPWEVQRGLSLSELRLPDNLSKSEEEAPLEKRLGDEEDEEDNLGVVTAPPAPGTAPDMMSAPQAAATTAAPGMLFVMDSVAAAQGLCFWSGAILQPIDVAFIAPIEPTATDSPSFRELRQRHRQRTSTMSGYDTSRFFPDGELDSPTVTFAIQSYTHLDPFPHSGESASVNREKRQHAAQPEDVRGDGSHLRYVLETTRHLLRDSIARAVREQCQVHCTAAGAAMAVDVDGVKGESEEGVEIILTLRLSEELKEELRAKARLYTNYVVPLEECISYHIRHQCTAAADPADGVHSVDGDAAGSEKGVAVGNDLALCDSTTTSGVLIHPSRVDRMGEDRRLPLRSPSLADEVEGTSMHLAPSVVGRHEAPVLQRAQQEQNQLLSAKAIARYPNTSARMTTLQPIDYELFDLCLRLGLCQRDVIYYYYGRILRVWQRELRRLKTVAAATTTKVVCDGEQINDADVRRMLLLVCDPSLQLPAELVACVKAVAIRRGVDGISVGSGENASAEAPIVHCS